jgi:hypothetical protein
MELSFLLPCAEQMRTIVLQWGANGFENSDASGLAILWCTAERANRFRHAMKT